MKQSASLFTAWRGQSIPPTSAAKSRRLTATVSHRVAVGLHTSVRQSYASPVVLDLHIKLQNVLYILYIMLQSSKGAGSLTLNPFPALVARAHTHTHARTHARTHAHTHTTHTHTRRPQQRVSHVAKRRDGTSWLNADCSCAWSREAIFQERNVSGRPNLSVRFSL